MKITQDVFQPIPMAVWQGYTKLGVIYPKGWFYKGRELEEDLCEATKPKYMKRLLKHYERNYK